MHGQNSRKCKRIQTSRVNNRQKLPLEKARIQYDKELLHNTQCSTQNLKIYTTNSTEAASRIYYFIKTRLLQRIII